MTNKDFSFLSKFINNFLKKCLAKIQKIERLTCFCHFCLIIFYYKIKMTKIKKHKQKHKT